MPEPICGHAIAVAIRALLHGDTLPEIKVKKKASPEQKRELPNWRTNYYYYYYCLITNTTLTCISVGWKYFPVSEAFPHLDGSVEFGAGPSFVYKLPVLAQMSPRYELIIVEGDTVRMAS
jgi:hypothetical protein